MAIVVLGLTALKIGGSMKTMFAILGVLMLLITVACHQSLSQSHIEIDSESNSDFGTAFALEPTCRGLTVVDGSESHEWTVVFTEHDGFQDEYPAGQGNVELFHKVPNGTDLFFAVPSAQDAARRVCFVIKGKGGRVQ